MKLFRHLVNFFVRLLRLLLSNTRKLVSLLAQPGLAFGKRVYLGPNVRIRVSDGGLVVVGDRTAVADGATIIGRRGRVLIGDDGHVGYWSVIVAIESIEIGTDSLIGEGVSIRDQNHGIENSVLPFRAQSATSSPIKIGNNVWLGAKSTVTAGVTIGDNVVVGANSVVCDDLPSNCVAVGVPARVIRTLES